MKEYETNSEDLQAPGRIDWIIEILVGVSAGDFAAVYGRGKGLEQGDCRRLIWHNQHLFYSQTHTSSANKTYPTPGLMSLSSYSFFLEYFS